jgi:hypothetical protein
MKANKVSTRISGKTQKRERTRFTTPAHIGHQFLQMNEMQALHFAKKDLRQQGALRAHSRQRTRRPQGLVEFFGGEMGINVLWQRQHSAWPLGLETRHEARGN